MAALATPAIRCNPLRWDSQYGTASGLAQFSTAILSPPYIACGGQTGKGTPLVGYLNGYVVGPNSGVSGASYLSAGYWYCHTVEVELSGLAWPFAICNGTWSLFAYSPVWPNPGWGRWMTGDLQWIEATWSSDLLMWRILLLSEVPETSSALDGGLSLADPEGNYSGLAGTGRLKWGGTAWP
jgi:hypothetical protein